MDTKKPLCAIPGCGKRGRITRGWCVNHYARWLRFGDPLGTAKTAIKHRQEKLSFLATAARCSSDECLIWPFAKSASGYGAIWIDGKDQAVHRIVCELAHGDCPSPKHETAHQCGHRDCVNGRHLRWATRKQNHADKLLHGTAQRGERHPMVKLKEIEVQAIRALRGKMKQRDIAAKFGITIATVVSIYGHRHWKWLQ